MLYDAQVDDYYMFYLQLDLLPREEFRRQNYYNGIWDDEWFLWAVENFTATIIFNANHLIGFIVDHWCNFNKVFVQLFKQIF